MTGVGVWAGGRRLAGWLRTREGRWLLLLVVGALAVRLPFLGYPGYFKDLQGYVDWGRALNTHFWDFYRYGATLPTPPAYPPLAEYLFGFLTATYPALAHLLGAQVTFDAAHSPLLAAYFKVPLIACDLATVVVVFALARRVVARRWA